MRSRALRASWSWRMDCGARPLPRSKQNPAPKLLGWRRLQCEALAASRRLGDAPSRFSHRNAARPSRKLAVPRGRFFAHNRSRTKLNPWGGAGTAWCTAPLLPRIAHAQFANSKAALKNPRHFTGIHTMGLPLFIAGIDQPEFHRRGLVGQNLWSQSATPSPGIGLGPQLLTLKPPSVVT